MSEDRDNALEHFLEKVAGPNRPARTLIVLLGTFFIALPLLWAADKLSLYLLSRSYVDEIAFVFDINQHYAKALSIIVFMLVTFLSGKIGFSKNERSIGIAGIAALLVVHSILLGVGTKNQFFDRAGRAIKCYVITREGDVRYLEHVGTDPQTGRACREATPEAVERLQEYQSGKRPSRIDDRASITFFEPRTGEPIVWFWHGKSGEIELFNLMGFHPENGEELNPVTRGIVEIYRAQAAQRAQKLRDAELRKRAPERVDPESYDFFDATTGEPQVWYWRNTSGDLEFFNNRGFHPKSGEALKVVDARVIADWREHKHDKETRETQLRERKEREARELEQRQEAEAKSLAEAQEQRRQEEAERAQREAKAGASCDLLAANPSDARKPRDVPGVRYEELKNHVSDALAACRVALDQHPDEMRYSYQYGRALQVNEPDKAIPIFRRLIGQNYPAAYDNLANTHIRKHEMRIAIAILKSGVKAEDADSMVTLSDLVESGYVQVSNPVGAKQALLERAARLGHSGAQLALERMKIDQQYQQQRAFQQQQEQQMMIDVFGTILRSVAH